jgi:hypothetical protein
MTDRDIEQLTLERIAAIVLRDRPELGYDDDEWFCKALHEIHYHLKRYEAVSGKHFAPALRAIGQDERPPWWQRLWPHRHEHPVTLHAVR